MKVKATYLQQFDKEKGVLVYVPILIVNGEYTSIKNIEFGVETPEQATAISKLAKALLLSSHFEKSYLPNSNTRRY